MDAIPLTIEIAQQSAEIYKVLKAENQMIEFRDIFIGATALELNVMLLTLNEKHFERIKEIKLYNKKTLT